MPAKGKKIRFSNAVQDGVETRAQTNGGGPSNAVNGHTTTTPNGSMPNQGVAQSNGAMIGPQLPNGKGKAKANSLFSSHPQPSVNGAAKSALNGYQAVPEAEALRWSPDTQLPANAFEDALNAAIKEYQVRPPYSPPSSVSITDLPCTVQSYHPSSTASEPVVLPQTPAEKLQASVLYYGLPPVLSPAALKKRYVVPHTERPRWQPPPAPASPSRGTTAPGGGAEVRVEDLGSDLDEDEFADVFGYDIPRPAAEAADVPREGAHEDDEYYEDEEEGEEWDEEEERPVGDTVGSAPSRTTSSEVEDSLLPSLASAPASATKASSEAPSLRSAPAAVVAVATNTHLPTLPEPDGDDMELSGGRSPSPSPPVTTTHLTQPQSQPHSVPHSQSNTRSPVLAPAVAVAEGSAPDPNPSSSNPFADLSSSQQTLLSNALSAQYWAGYHTALFHRSIGKVPEEAVPPSVTEREAADGAEAWRNGRQAGTS